MNFDEELRNADFDELFDALTGYAALRLKDVDPKLLAGKEPEDFVSDILEKVVRKIRNPDNAKCSLREFLFGCLRSDLSSFFKKLKNEAPPVEDPELCAAVQEISAGELQAWKDAVVNQLTLNGADQQEIAVFDCWADGILKPAQVGTELDLTASEVNTISRRLYRRLDCIKKLLFQDDK